jgi:RNA polymerase sigma-70 factor (ECF subfamily)
MKSLAAKADRLEFASFQSLLAFLNQAAEKKVIDEYRKAHTLKRDVTRVCPLDAAGDGDGDGGRPLGVASGDPTASQLALAGEAHERLLAGQSGPNRDAIVLKEQGYTCTEIAEQTGWNLRKVQRFFKGLQESFLGA